MTVKSVEEIKIDHNEKDILKVINQIDDWKGKDIKYEQVLGGITNPNWKVNIGDEAYFVKIPGRGTESFIDRGNAHAANLIAANEDIGPAVHYYFEDSGVEVFEWLEGYRTLNFGDVLNKEIFYKIIDVIKKFHRNKKTKLSLTKTPFEQTFTMIKLAQELKGYMPPEMDRMEWLAHKIEDSIMTAGIDYVPCHNDHWSANYLYNESTGDLRLTDFEYAAMSDACWDAADMASSNYFHEAMDKEWIRYYYHEYDELLFARLKLYKILSDIRWSMWSIVQSRQSSIQDYDYYEWFGTKMSRLRQFWNDPRLDYWLKLVKGISTF
jgi:thiamine kinase-like enzyme